MQFQEDVVLSFQTIQDGGIILCPTDTVWGLSADALNESAVERINQLKHRPLGKSFILLFQDASAVQRYYTGNLDLSSYFNKYSDRPTSFILHDLEGLPTPLYGPDFTIAIRIPKDEFLNQLLKKLNKPIVSTSANVNGFPTPGSYFEIASSIKTGVDYLVKYRQEETTSFSASRILAISQKGDVEIIRE